MSRASLGVALLADGPAYDADLNTALHAQVPEPLRASQIARIDLPTELQSAFSTRSDKWRLDLRSLPEPLMREMQYGVWCIVRSGGKVPVSHVQRLLHALRGALLLPDARGRSSLMDASVQAWTGDLLRAEARRKGRPTPARGQVVLEQTLRRVLRFVAAAYDRREWWRRDAWSLDLDPRIPRREREPQGASAHYFDGFEVPWLREGVKWYLSRQLTAGAFTWSTVKAYRQGIKTFDGYVAERGVPGPWLADDDKDIRPLILDYVATVRARITHIAKEQQKPVGRARISRLMTDVEQFYGFMTEHGDEAAQVLGEPGWTRLNGAHARFFHFGEKPRMPPRVEVGSVFDDSTMRQVMERVDVLALPKHEGGLGDEQAMRAVLLAATLGRRINEILMMDYDPILPLLAPSAEADGAGFVAKLRYGQTKIEGAPETLPIDADTRDIITAQQTWVQRIMAERSLTVTPRWLFLGVVNNRTLQRPYPMKTLHLRLREFSDLVDLRDSTGKRVYVSRTHQFRHTAATSLLQRGVPLPAIQRFLGHLSPTMTLRYAHLTAEQELLEFIRYRKVTAKGEDLGISPEDLYDMLKLDERADRILPNGWCMLPPRQSCDRGNACLTCNKFATDATHLDEHQHQLDLVGSLIDRRTSAFETRTGKQMPDDNVWLAERRREAGALEQIIRVLTSPGYDQTSAVLGAGTTSRSERDA